MASDGPGVLHLLASHRALLARHRPRLAELLDLAVASGLKETPLGAIVASLASDFGRVCVDAGPEFVIADDALGAASVLVLGLDALIEILAATIPDAVPYVLGRPLMSLAIVLVDADDEPALVLVPFSSLTVSRA